MANWIQNLFAPRASLSAVVDTNRMYQAAQSTTNVLLQEYFQLLQANQISWSSAGEAVVPALLASSIANTVALRTFSNRLDAIGLHAKAVSLRNVAQAIEDARARGSAPGGSALQQQPALYRNYNAIVQSPNGFITVYTAVVGGPRFNLPNGTRVLKGICYSGSLICDVTFDAPGGSPGRTVRQTASASTRYLIPA